MNFVEVSQVLSKMISTTLVVQRNLAVNSLKKGLLIDKKNK